MGGARSSKRLFLLLSVASRVVASRGRNAPFSNVLPSLRLGLSITGKFPLPSYIADVGPAAKPQCIPAALTPEGVKTTSTAGRSPALSRLATRRGSP